MSQSTIVRAMSQVAVVGWGLGCHLDTYLKGVKDDSPLELMLDSIAEKYDEAEVWDVRKAEHAEGFRKHFVLDCKARGVKHVYFVVKKVGEEFRVLLGDLAVAGIEFVVISTTGEAEMRSPLSIRYQEVHRSVRPQWTKFLRGKTEVVGMKEIGTAELTGQWRAGNYKGQVFYLWQEKRWSYEELRDTEMPFGSVIMWKPSDYDEMELEDGRPCSPPDWMGYPHTLELKGIRMCRVPLRYLDYLVGQPWIYGEFAQRLRQWLGQPAIREELKRFDDRELESTLVSDSTGYWDEKDNYVYTGCQGGKPQYDVPVWLTPRDRFGNELKSRSKYNETMIDRAAKVMEQLGYEEFRDEPPHTWVFGTPWLFESYDAEEGDVEERNLDERYEVLDEEEQGRRKKAREYDARKLLTEEERKNIEWDLENLGKESAEALEILEERRKQAERNAWYEYLEIGDELQRVGEEARTAETPEQWEPVVEREAGPEEGSYGRRQSLVEKGKSLVARATPLLREIVGPKAFGVLREQAARVKADVTDAEKRCAGDRLHAVAEVLREHPWLVTTLVRTNLELAAEMFAAYPEFVREEETKREVRVARRLMAERYPELYTKKGTWRKKKKAYA